MKAMLAALSLGAALHTTMPVYSPEVDPDAAAVPTDARPDAQSAPPTDAPAALADDGARDWDGAGAGDADPDDLAGDLDVAEVIPEPVPWAFTVSTSAYAWGCGASGPTRSGTAVRWGVVATDPRVIPLGTRLEIEGFAGTTFVAEDTGSAVVGRKVDIFWPAGCASARVYGRQARAVRFVA